jgi:hypothetical protein
MLGPDDLAILTKRIPLKHGEPHLPPPHADSCEATSGFASREKGVEVLVGQNRSTPNGVGRIAVHVVRRTGTACVEIEYPWSS